MQKEEVCCQKFDPKRWDGKTHKWSKKKFIKDEVVQFMHIPLNMGTVVKRMFGKIEAVKAAPANKDFLMLCFDPSPWKSEIYMTTTKEVPGAKNVTMSGKFFSRTFEGPYQDVPKWYKEMEKYSKKQYFHFAYCPKCAKKYGKNWVVDFAQIEG